MSGPLADELLLEHRTSVLRTRCYGDAVEETHGVDAIEVVSGAAIEHTRADADGVVLKLEFAEPVELDCRGGETVAVVGRRPDK